MNRNFKFRVWSVKENKWMFGYEQPDLGGFSLTGEVVLFGEFGKYELDRYYTDFVIMQWTGLVDKNGKEIYENDIIRISGGLKLDCYPDTGQIVFNQHSASFVMRAKNNNNVYMNFSLGFSDGTEIEVIGNIYEDRSLLKK